MCCHFFFFNDTATTEIYTLSLHDALPICQPPQLVVERVRHVCPQLARITVVLVFCPSRDERGTGVDVDLERLVGRQLQDRKSTRLNSSHANISYAVFCLKKKK